MLDKPRGTLGYVHNNMYTVVNDSVHVHSSA